MFDPNPLNNVPEQIKDMYSKAFEAANSGMTDAFKDLPKHMQDALDSAGIKDMLDGWDDLSDKIKDAKKQLDDKAKSLKKIIDMAEHLNDLLRDQAEIEIDMAKEERDKATTLQDFLKKQDTVDRTTTRWNAKLANSGGLLNKMKQSYMGVSTAHAALNQHQNTFTKGQAASTLLTNAFGKKWTGLIGTFRALTGGGLAMFAALGKGIGMVTAQLSEAYQVSRNMGYGVTQSISNIGTGITDFLKNLSQGTLTSVKTQVELRNLFSRELGNRDAPSEVQGAASDMVAYYRMSTQESAKLSAALYRNNRFNAQAVVKDMNILVNTARNSGLGEGELLKEAANNANILATYAERGTAAFARSAAEVRKLGLSMQSVSGFADRMVNDFESSLMMQAKIQTIMPGADFSEVQYASQFGTEGDVAAALKSALGGRNIMSLPRSLRNMISQSTGLGMEELRNLDRGTTPNDKGVVVGSDKDERGTVMGLPVEKFIGSIDGAVSQLNLFSAALILATTRIGTSMIGNAMGGASGAATTLGAKALGAAKFAGRASGAIALGSSAIDIGASAMSAKQGEGVKAATESAGRNKFTLAGTALGGIAGGVFGIGAGAIPGAATGAGIGGIADMVWNYFADNYFADKSKGASAEVRHSGGIIGSRPKLRTVHPSVFEGAPKFHKGLMPDEVPSILQRGEAVLSRQQLSGLTNLMRSTQALGKVGDKVGNLKLDGLMNFGEGVSSLAKTFTSSTLGNFSQFTEALTGGSKGGIGGMLSDFIGQKTSGIMGSITDMLGGKSGGIMGSITSGITDMLGGKSGSSGGGITGAISGLFGGNKSGGVVSSVTNMLSGKGGGITGAISGLFGGKKGEGASGGIGNMVSGLFGGKAGGIASALTGKGGLQGAATSGLKGVASNLVSKIPGIGGIASSLIKGGGAKGVIGNVGKSLAGKAIGTKVGAALGSVVPGLGTLVGAGVGALASKYGGKLIGGVKNIAGKLPGVSTAAKVVSGVAGKAVGGIKKLFGFGKKKKPAVVAQEQPQMASPEMMALNSSASEYTGTVLGGANMAAGGSQSIVKVDNANLESLLTQLIAATKEGKDIYLDGKKVGNSLVNAYSRDT